MPIKALAKEINQHFAYMSEKERLLFLDTGRGADPIFLSFCLTYRDGDRSLIGAMYDVALRQKGLVVSSVAALRRRIAASGDKEALSLLDRLAERKTQLANLLNTRAQDAGLWRKKAEELQQQVNEIERELARRSNALAEDKRLAEAGWRDVQKALANDEAAVEFVRFPFHSGKRWTGRSYYVALVLTPESKSAPDLVLLGEAEKLESVPLRDYREQTQLRGPPSGNTASTSYEAFWKPLQNALDQTKAKRIFLSPDGLLNVVSWGVIQTPDGQRLLDKYDLRIVSNTKDILRPRNASAAQSAVLIGNPRFDLEEGEQREIDQALQKARDSKVAVASLARGLLSRDQRAASLQPLPGTQEELQAVRSLLQRSGWRVELYSEERALEEVVKRVPTPRILHLATHGFFLPDQEHQQDAARAGLPSREEDPMLRSGLFLAGANRTLRRAPRSPDLEDGVLTAYEASGLNLEGTELVVLSACETGLGGIKNGEGVFGLRRALQVAGAEAVLMSLWSVPDQETKELMSLFYQKWLSGSDKHQALRQAQLELRAKVRARYGQDLPFYWGAFVLVGR